MFKKRMLLLVAALAAFGAVMVSGVFATPSGQSSAWSHAEGGGPNSNGYYVIENPSITAEIFHAGNYVVPPTGAWTPGGYLRVQNHTSYGVTITNLDVDATDAPGCGGTTTMDAQFNPIPNADIAGGAYKDATFDVKIGPDALITNACQFSGHVVVTAEQDLTP